MPENPMSGAEKAAVLLLTIGEEAAAEIFKGLDEAEIRQIGSAMSGMREIPVPVVSRVMDEFRREMVQPRGVVTNAKDFLNQSLGKALEPAKARTILSDLVAGQRPRGLKALETADPKTVARLLGNEHPQICAVVLSMLAPKVIAGILAFFPPERLSDVLLRMGKLQKISPPLLHEIEEAMHLAPAAGEREAAVPAGGIKLVAQTLNSMKKELETRVIEKLHAADPEMTESIRKNQFTFEDLIGVDDRSLQAILREVNRDVMVVALKAASTDLQEKFLRNVSERAAEMIRDDMEAMGPVKITEVETARQELIHVARRLEEEGKVTLRSPGDDDDVVR